MMTAVTDSCVLLSNNFALLLFNYCTAGQKITSNCYFLLFSCAVNATYKLL